MISRVGRTGSDKAGFTIVESLVAVFTLSIFVAGVCALLVAARESIDRASMHYTAVNIAKNRLERLRTFEYGDMVMFAESDVRVDNEGNPDNAGHYQRSTTVSNVSARLLDVTVEVGVQDRVTLGFEGEKEVVQSYFTKYEELGE